MCGVTKRKSGDDRTNDVPENIHAGHDAYEQDLSSWASEKVIKREKRCAYEVSKCDAAFDKPEGDDER